jgi:DUF1680 family protein
MKYRAFSPGSITLFSSLLTAKREANRRYLLSLDSAKLLRNYDFEAGLWSDPSGNPDVYGGWESPTSQLRGHFLGHWLSAAARLFAATGDTEIKGKADAIVAHLAKCQEENGGEWAGSIPEKYFEWMKAGKTVWAPHYTVHKTFMGLIDMYRYADNAQALDIARKWARWFYRWSAEFSPSQFSAILDYETGGMLEIWADLYAATKDKKYLELIDRYYRHSLFDPLLEGKDVLSNMHANTTIPEILGAARVYEVTGEKQWLDIVTAYWKMAVTRRGQFATGGQSCGEIWTPRNHLSARLGDKNQEHCTVYNMMRLADFLFRQTGDAAYADYWELNLYNGIFAQGYWQGTLTNGQTAEYPLTGLITYYLPLRAGARKGWGSETTQFYCCHGTLVQANAAHTDGLYYASQDELVVCQYFPSEVKCEVNTVPVTLRQEQPYLSASIQKVNEKTVSLQEYPGKKVVVFHVTAEEETTFTLSLRLPSWLCGSAVITVNGTGLPPADCGQAGGFCRIRRKWHSDYVVLEMPHELKTVSLPDDEETVAFRDGPVVLAGLVTEDRILYGDRERPLSLLRRDNEKEWEKWQGSYRTINQDPGIRFIPLYAVGYEPYSVYFRVHS